jgi:hypothetical protein
MAKYAKFFSVGGGVGPNGLQLPLGTILDATLRQVQDGTGTGSPLYLSTGGLRVGTTAGSAMYWDDVNNRLGIGTTTPLGILHLKSTAATTRMVMDGDAGQSKIITYRTAGLQRFGLYVNNTAESGSNAGSDFAIRAYSDAGTLLNTPIFIKRSTGYVGIGTNAPTSPLSISSTSSSIFDWSRVSGSTGYLAVTNIRSGAGQGTVFGVDQFSFRNSSAVNYIVSEGNKLGIGTNNDALTSQLHIKGSGSTSATRSLLVQNSAAQQSMSILDDGSCTIGINGATTNSLTIVGNSGIQAIIGNSNFLSPSNIFRYGGGTLTFFGSNNDGTAFSFGFNNSQSSGTTTIAMIGLGGNYFTQGNFQFANLRINPTYDFASNTTSNAIARGIYYNPTITNLRVAQHRAIETTTGDVLFGTTSGNVGIGTSSPDKLLTVGSPNYGGWVNGEPTIKFNKDLGVLGSLSIAGDSSVLYLWRSGAPTNGSTISSNYDGSGGSLRLGVVGRTDVNIMQNNGDVTIGNNITTLSAKLGVKGNGSTSATTSLLVQNSGGSELLKVTDDGLVTGAAITSTGTLRAANNRLEVFNSGNQVIMRNPVVGNFFYIGPSNVCGCDAPFVCPSIFLNSGGIYGSNTGVVTNTQAYAMPTQLNPIGGANSCLINLYGGGRLQGSADGQYIRVEGNMQLDSSSNELTGFYFNPTLSGAFSPQNVRAIQSTYGGGYFNTTTPQASAVLQADSTTQGFLPPRMTSAQKNAISSPANGLIVYDTDLVRPCFFNGATWITL